MTFDATPSGDTSTSFVTVEDALVYQFGRPGAPLFAALPQEDQEGLLMWATQDITMAVNWSGEMVSPTQALPVPMKGQTDLYGRPIPEDIVPPLVQQATSLYALVLQSQGGQTLATTGDVEHLKKGDTEVWYTTRSSSSNPAPWGLIPPSIWALLAPYGTVPTLGSRMPVYRG